MLESGKCDLCRGAGKYLDGRCTFCNGTGEWNNAAQAFVRNHICQCITLDRKNCPICHKPCHHDTSLDPKQKIDSGHDGIGVVFGGSLKTDDEVSKTEDIVA